MRVSALSKQYLRVPIGEPPGTGSYTARAALVPVGTTPAGGDWKAATVASNGDVLALVGPGSVIGAKTAGRYRVWVELTVGSEVAVLEAPSDVEVY